MTPIDTARHHLLHASDLAAVLDAAYEAFEAMLSALEPVQDPASDLFTPLVMAAASAADGRDTITHAPSLPRHPLHPPPPHEQPGPSQRPDHTARIVATLSRQVAERLTRASAYAPDPTDQDTCRHAARHAHDIHGFLTGTL